ncbi:hypothetical protein NQ176_g322 [Zarea fungicola]|uniref:Uncharacterized protein n=1 Tax=Zarea fungicola TaxID=93591 RepID=A0ACC1NYC7_9HYPO|nr:hypothetical protein NQ176_g322 [Lecanicillium fungicola]
MLFSTTHTAGLVTALGLLTGCHAANCGNQFLLEIVPSGYAWNVLQACIRVMAEQDDQDGDLVCSYDKPWTNYLQIQAKWKHGYNVNLEGAFNEIWNQCMNNGYRCKGPYQTGTWQYGDEWYWVWWNYKYSGANKHWPCGFAQGENDSGAALPDEGTSSAACADPSNYERVDKVVTGDYFNNTADYDPKKTYKLVQLTAKEGSGCADL